MVSSIVEISAGAQHTLALSLSGKLVFWGRHTYTPTLIKTGSLKFTQIAVGTLHSLALSRDGHIYSWGYGGKVADFFFSYPSLFFFSKCALFRVLWDMETQKTRKLRQS